MFWFFCISVFFWKLLYINWMRFCIFFVVSHPFCLNQKILFFQKRMGILWHVFDLKTNAENAVCNVENSNIPNKFRISKFDQNLIVLFWQTGMPPKCANCWETLPCPYWRVPTGVRRRSTRGRNGSGASWWPTNPRDGHRSAFRIFVWFTAISKFHLFSMSFVHHLWSVRI